MAWWTTDRGPETIDDWKQSLREACRWLTDVSMIRTGDSGEYPHANSSFKWIKAYADWRGAFRGEYRAHDKKWDVFCPIWHGGQAVKALVMAYETLSDTALLDAARAGGEFILRNQITIPGDPDVGMLLAYETASQGLNSSASLEALDGLFALARATGEARYNDAALAALRWSQRRMFIADTGRFHDEYDHLTRKLLPPSPLKTGQIPGGRPLLDDGVFITGWKLTGDTTLRDVAVRTADCLLADENPAGNWVGYVPNNPETGVIHPRHAYWWGRPMWMIHRALEKTGAPSTSKYLDACRRSAQWYVAALRTDGGLFRDTNGEFKTPSFGHANSGAACAAIHFLDLAREFGDTQWDAPARKVLRFCRSVQFTNASDPNLEGAILEKVLPPGRSDRPPWYLRDVGTIFYVQALAMALRDRPGVLIDVVPS